MKKHKQCGIFSALRYLICTVMLLQLCACNNTTPVPDTQTNGNTITSDSTVTTISIADTAEVTVSETSTAASVSETTAETTLTVESETDISVSDTSVNTTTQTNQSTVTEPPAETTVSETSIAADTVSETTVANTPKPEPVIPTVKKVSSSGTAAFVSESGTIDYSNSSDGYFSVTYKGDKKFVKLRVQCNNTTYNHDVSANGTTEYFPLHAGSGEYTVGLYELVSSSDYSLVCSGTFKANVSSSTDMYLYPNKYVNFNQNSAIVQKVAEVTAGCSTDFDKITSIFTYITDNITYDKKFAADVQSGKITSHTPNPDSTLKSKKGICFDYASLFCAMTRAEGIPSRLVVGYASPEIYHAWNDVYTEETGWVTVEFYLDKTGFNRVDATFYASSNDKKKISEYINKNSNYSSLYIY